MNKLIQKFIEAREKVGDAMEVERLAEKKAERAPLPSNLTEAKPGDIVGGAIIWYPRFQDEDPDSRRWKIVDEVLKPADAYKAYCAHDGCRYGLYGAFVEID